MLKKITPFLLAVLTALTLALAPAQNAAAWDRVCMHFPLWKTWYAGRFYVTHTFQGRPGKVPNSVYLGSGYRVRVRLPHFGRETDPAPNAHANSQIVSSDISANKSACVDIRGIPNGQPFFVHVGSFFGGSGPTGEGNVLCKTHRSNPNPWYTQQNRPYKTLWYHAWGVVRSPKCEFKHES